MGSAVRRAFWERSGLSPCLGSRGRCGLPTLTRATLEPLRRSWPMLEGMAGRNLGPHSRPSRRLE
eukprot:13293969-Alexandrium_andersonii.AAC.1